MKKCTMVHAVRTSVIIASLVAASGCTEASTPGVLPNLQHDPILFVHGYGGSSANWETMKQKFANDGWQPFELYSFNYSFISSNAATAQEIRDQVNDILRQTGATKVDIIAHSMGSVSSRYYMKNLGGSDKVDAWVSLAGPNHGTDAVENQNCQFTPCREIVPGSAFLLALNGGDETPGPARYATWRSPCDTTINPDETVILAGAVANTLTACIVHFNFLLDDTIYQQVRDFVD